MSRHQRPNPITVRERWSPERSPRGWVDLIVIIVQRYPVRIMGSILAAILGLTLDVSCERDEHTSDPAAVVTRAPIPAPARPKAANGVPLPTPVTPADPVIVPDADDLRHELGGLPGSGHSGVTELLERYGLGPPVSPSAVRPFIMELRKALVGADRSERLGAARVLTRLGPAAGSAELVVLSRDEGDEVRLTALRGLGRMIGDDVEPAVARLSAVVSDPRARREDRFQAIQSLSRIRVGFDLEPVARVGAEERDPLLRLAAARTLLSHRDQRAVQVLVRLLDGRSDDRCTPDERQLAMEEANRTLLEVAPEDPPAETATGWTQVVPQIVAKLDEATFRYVPRTLYLPR